MPEGLGLGRQGRPTQGGRRRRSHGRQQLWRVAEEPKTVMARINASSDKPKTGNYSAERFTQTSIIMFLLLVVVVNGVGVGDGRDIGEAGDGGGADRG